MFRVVLQTPVDKGSYNLSKVFFLLSNLAEHHRKHSPVKFTSKVASKYRKICSWHSCKCRNLYNMSVFTGKWGSQHWPQLGDKQGVDCLNLSSCQ